MDTFEIGKTYRVKKEFIDEYTEEARTYFYAESSRGVWHETGEYRNIRTDDFRVELIEKGETNDGVIGFAVKAWETTSPLGTFIAFVGLNLNQYYEEDTETLATDDHQGMVWNPYLNCWRWI